MVNDCSDWEITGDNARPISPKLSLRRSSNETSEMIYVAEPIRTGRVFSLPSRLEFMIELRVAGIIPKTIIWAEVMAPL
jgi:hypothetical protein